MTDTIIEGNPSNETLDQDKQIHKDVLQTISVTLSVEVGRAMIKIKDLMRLTQGSVVELDRIAGEPLDLLVNDTVVAQGEVVLVNERYGIRLTRVVPASERMKNLCKQHHGNNGIKQHRLAADRRKYRSGVGASRSHALDIATPAFNANRQKRHQQTRDCRNHQHRP